MTRVLVNLQFVSLSCQTIHMGQQMYQEQQLPAAAVHRSSQVAQELLDSNVR